MKLIDAIETVLKEADAPMRPAEIAEEILSKGLWETTGKTPADTVGARLYVDIKLNGENSRFRKAGKGALFAINPNAPAEAPVIAVEENAGVPFPWTAFYEEMADRLLAFRTRRGELIKAVHEICSDFNIHGAINDQDEDGKPILLEDICPFTTFALFNRVMSEAKRRDIARRLATFLGMETPVPKRFDGTLKLNSQDTWFFRPKYDREAGDIDSLWECFALALQYAGGAGESVEEAFKERYEKVMSQGGVLWKLTLGLYWIRPRFFLPIGYKPRHYITSVLGRERIGYGLKVTDGYCKADDYVKLQKTFLERFQEPSFPVHSFQELALVSEELRKDEQAPEGTTSLEDSDDLESEDQDDAIAETTSSAPPNRYDIDSILSEGCFLPRQGLEEILERLQDKKNIILQGPPGTGKTWLAKRLAYALIGVKDPSRIRSIQFHPNLSYEDFIRGWRPSGAGTLDLVDGPFMEAIDAAQKDPDKPYVVVIEEINRGNPAQIFGDMLTLLEKDKRTPSEALELAYKRGADEKVYIPANLHVIGTMNVADRSLALVDFALRRRFAFIALEPTLNDAWARWLAAAGFPKETIETIHARVKELNESIANDPGLGPQFRIGHSYVTPAAGGTPIQDGLRWFRQVAETEIAPLLDEYWFDNPEKAKKQKGLLVSGL